MDIPPPQQPPGTEPPVFRFDWRDWLPYFEDDDIPEDKKRVLIETLWSIIIAFVDLGWSVSLTAGADGGGDGVGGMGAQSCGRTFDLKAALEAAVLRSDAAGDDKKEEA